MTIVKMSKVASIEAIQKLQDEVNKCLEMRDNLNKTIENLSSKLQELADAQIAENDENSEAFDEDEAINASHKNDFMPKKAKILKKKKAEKIKAPKIKTLGGELGNSAVNVTENEENDSFDQMLEGIKDNSSSSFDEIFYKPDSQREIFQQENKDLTKVAKTKGLKKDHSKTGELPRVATIGEDVENSVPKGWKTELKGGSKMEIIVSPTGQRFKSRFSAIQTMINRNKDENGIFGGGNLQQI